MGRPTETREVVYLWKMGDQYESRDGFIFRKASASSKVSLHHELEFPSENTARPVIQVSSDIQFNADVTHFASLKGEIALDQASVGENYWRVVNSQGKTGKTRHFRVRPEYLPVQPHLAHFSAPTESQRGFQIPLQLSSGAEYAWHLVEIAKSADFLKSQIVWATGDTVSLWLETQGQYFLRFQGVTHNQELSQFSPVYEMNLRRGQLTPQPKKSPQLTSLAKVAFRSIN